MQDDYTGLCAFWAITGVIGLWMGDQRGRAGSGLLAGLVLGPFGLLCVLALRPSQYEVERRVEMQLKAEAVVRERMAKQAASMAAAASGQAPSSPPVWRPPT